MKIFGFIVQVQKRKLHKKFCNSVPRLRIRTIEMLTSALNRSKLECLSMSVTSTIIQYLSARLEWSSMRSPTRVGSGGSH